jgi:penicillin amidase
VLVRWPVYAQTRSTITTGLALDRARDVRDALQILARYRGSPQNFVLADRDSEVAYHVAGLVPNDPAWGRYVHPARDLRLAFAPLSYTQLPESRPSRGGVLVSANNKAYAGGYRYRLSAQFEPPYRAFRIASLLNRRERYDAEYFAGMQLDTLSPVDLEIARDVASLLSAHRQSEATVPDRLTIAVLRGWDGRYSPGSRAAVLEHQLRDAVFSEGPAFNARLSELREEVGGASRGSLENDSSALAQDIEGTLGLFAFRDRHSWSDAGGMRIEHLLAPMHFGFLNGDWLPGEGDEYTIHLQEPGLAQGFRAVWEVGDWDRGGISIPSGESGAPGSGHYTDLTADWVSGTLRPLPFGDAAVEKARAATLTLRPR